MASLSNINGIFDVHSTGAILFSTSHGANGQILKSNGNAAPTWVDASTVIGGPYLPLSGGTLTGATATASSISFTVGGVLTGQANSNTFGTASASGRALIVQSGSSNQAIMLKNNLGGDGTISATGTATTMNYSFGTYSVAPALFIQNDGKVGIGTDSPGELFEVMKDGGAIIRLHDPGNNSWKLKADTDFHIYDDSGSDYLTIKNSGNVGIGTIAPSKTLQVSSSATGDLMNILCVNTHDTDGDTASIGFSMVDLNYQKAAVIFERKTTQGRGSLHFATNNVAGNNNVGKGDARMTILSGGDVGIGTTIPSQKLDVDGQVTHEGLVLKSGTGLYVDTITIFNITLDFVAGNWIDTGLTSLSNGGLTLGASGTYIMQIYSDDHSPGEPYWYSMYWSGIMSWYASNTNQSTAIPVPLQRAGHGDNNRTLDARILWQTSSGTPANAGLLQFNCNATAPGTNLSLRFRRLL